MGRATQPKIKAYSVQEDDEGTGGVVFAKSPAAAQMLASGKWGTGDFFWGRARRAQWADAYGPDGPIPARAMIENGWWLECHGCGVHICENDDHLDTVVGTQDAAFCSQDCMDRKIIDDEAARDCELTAIGKLIRLLGEKYPGVLLSGETHANARKGKEGMWHVHQCIVGFTFPGSKIGPGHIRYDKVGEEPRVTVCSGDMAAWEAWRASQK
jgi:hypothetical protein